MSAATRKRRLQVLICLVALAAVAVIGAPVASAAGAPSIDATSVTDIQGISALLSGKVNPNGLPTTYRFEYGTSTCPGACTPTSQEALGSASVDRSASAAIAGLSPDTTYHYRLLATNSAQETAAGPEQTFTTTHGFGFLSGAAGFEAAATKLDGTPATQAGSHPYELTTSVNLNQGGESAGQPGVPFPDGDLKDLRLELPPGLIGNPSTVSQCTLAQFDTPRSSPFEASLSGESCPDRSQVGTVAVHSSFGGGSTRTFGLFNLTPPPGVAAELGFAPFGDPITFDGHVRTAEGEYGLTLEAKNFPQDLSIDGAAGDDLGHPLGALPRPRTRQLPKRGRPRRRLGQMHGRPAQDQFPATPSLPCPPPAQRRSPSRPPPTPGSAPAPSSPTAGWVAAKAASHRPSGAANGSFPTRSPTASRPRIGPPRRPALNSTSKCHQEGLLEPSGLTGSQIRERGRLPARRVDDQPLGGRPASASAPRPSSPPRQPPRSPGRTAPTTPKSATSGSKRPLARRSADRGSIFLAGPSTNPFDSLIGIYLVAKAPDAASSSRSPAS